MRLGFRDCRSGGEARSGRRTSGQSGTAPAWVTTTLGARFRVALSTTGRRETATFPVLELEVTLW